jgi:hypothetical protein
LKQKPLKTGHFRARPESALGTGALPFAVSLDSTTWKVDVVELCGTLGNFNYILPQRAPGAVAFALIPQDFLNHIIEERTCN